MDTAHRLVRVAAVLVPDAIRSEWTREWEAELASLHDRAPRERRPVRRALGAFIDAFWLRQRAMADFTWVDDLRYGWRQVTRHAAVSAAPIAILALGLAATVAMFAVMDQVLLRPLPYPEPDRIVTLWETRQDSAERLEVAPANFLDWRERLRSFDLLAGVEPWSLDFVGGSRPEVFLGSQVTPGVFEAFGVQPLHGRLFTHDEYQRGRDHVILLSERFWRQRFGADPKIVGTSLAFEDGLFQVVGILPASFEPRLLGNTRTVWTPKVIREYEPRIRASGYWAVVGRLRHGVALEAAQAELHAVSQQLAAEYPRTNQQTSGRVVPIRDHLIGDVRVAVALVAGAVVLVLLIACANVANLLLARGVAREREIAIRIALGGGRLRIGRQLLAETLLITLAGGLIGVLIAQGALAALAKSGPATIPWIETLHLDIRATAFAAVLSIAVTIVAGTLPAWRTTRINLAAAGRSTGTADRAQHRLRAGLVVAEMALALVLVAGAGLLIRSFIELVRVDPGFRRDHVMALQVFAFDHNPSPPQLWSFFANAFERLRRLPAVESVGAVSAMPFIESNINIQSDFAIAGRPAVANAKDARAYLTVATPGYFDAMRITLLRGRHLDEHDRRDSKRVAVISEELARRHWPLDDDPIGDRLRATFQGRPGEVEIVGVVAALRHDSLEIPARPEVFIPLAQVPFGSMTFVVRTASDPSSLMEAAKAAIWDVNPAQPIYRIATLDELVMRTVSPRRFTLAVLFTFAAVALLLAAAGVYGVMSAVTAGRLREVGVRVALGAGWWDIVGWILARGLTIAGIGIAAGLGGALGASQLLRGFLFGVNPIDWLSLAGAAFVMMTAAFIACYLPARRAAVADPVVVLRTE
jgi:putative ABC transport system permease protein